MPTWDIWDTKLFLENRMLYASSGGKLVLAKKGIDAECPFCGNKVVAKCGNIISWHWAHSLLFGCDAWAEPETEWHLWWKSVIGNISPRFIEKTIQKNGDRHRADAWFPNGTVYEFQHSPISTEEIHEREAFYGANGNLTWIFDAIEPFLRGRISVRSKDGYQTFRWKQARKSISACSANVFLDLGEALLHVKRIYSRPQRTYSKRINGHDVQVEQRAMFAGWGYVTDKADFVAKLKSDAKIFLESEISLEIESL